MQKYTVEINDNGTVSWYKEGTDIYHRADGPAIEFADGTKYWLQNGKLHRENGPAIEHIDGAKFWYQNDRLHRVDGPAQEFSDGTKYWWIEGVQYTEAEFNKHMNKDSTYDNKEAIIDGKTYKLSLVDKK